MTNWSRTPNNISAVCCSAVFTGTYRIRGRLDASTKRGTTLYHITPAGEERLESIKANFKPYLTNLIAAMQRLRRDLYGETS